MIIDSLAIVAGFILLAWSAERFVTGAAAVATALRVSPLIVGVSVVGFGTSAPEMLVAAFASFGGNSGLAIGNALGSNIANIALILGVTSIFIPLNVHSGIIRKELPLLMLAMLLMLLLILDDQLGRTDGILLVGTLVALMWWITRQAIQDKNDALGREYEQELDTGMSLGRAIAWLLAGMLVLLASSRLLVWGAVNIAQVLGVSDLIIGLTIVAIGTSLPELAASIACALKNEHDIAIGNIVGSNMFNTLGVMAVPGLIAPSTLPDGVLERDIPIVFILTIALFIMAYGIRGPGRINRFEGSLLFTAFVAYEAILFIAATGNGAG